MTLPRDRSRADTPGRTHEQDRTPAHAAAGPRGTGAPSRHAGHGEARGADGAAHRGTEADDGGGAHRGGGQSAGEGPRPGGTVPEAPGVVRADVDPAAPSDRLIARGEAHVWWWRCPERVDPADLALLGTDEFRRALGMLAERDAAEFVRTRAGARRALGELLDITPATVRLGHRRCPGCGADDHGPPLLVRPELPLAISLSRTAGWGVFVVGAGLAIGVDAEALRPVRETLFAGSVLTASERRHLDAMAPGPARHAAFHRVWTRKEAVVKAVGVGLVGTELDQLETHPDRDGPLRVTHHGVGRPTEWTVEDLRLSDHLAVALARAAGPAARGPVHLHPPTGP
ncbi:4'-phosphopantetheinyl transferase superfamily protein [Streptomyces sp. NPDC050674]|uniref:4'-phosphopantetheinyl transferase family protein n=1 Tax=Streptomyces sp. NPDC050674 TaxID=3157216 RepID=UPI00343CEADB